MKFLYGEKRLLPCIIVSPLRLNHHFNGNLLSKELSTRLHTGKNTKSSLLLFIISIALIAAPGVLHAQQSEFIPKSKKEIDREKISLQKERKKITSSNIFSVTKNVFQYKFGKPEKKSIPEYYRKFSKNGNRIEETSYNPIDGSIVTKSTFRYDAKGNIVEETVGRDDNIIKTSHRYNADNLLEETVIYNSAGAIDKKIVYTYDDRRLLLEVAGYLGDGRRYMNDSYYYGEENRVTELKNNLNKFSYSYDDDGNVSEIKKSSRYFKTANESAYHLTDFYQLSHDRNGNLTEISHYKADSTLRVRFQYMLDDKGKIVKENEIGSDLKPAYQRMYLYDKNGNVIEESGTDRGRKFRTAHKYDSRSNIIESIVYDQINEPAQFIKYNYSRYGVVEESTAARTAVKENSGNGTSEAAAGDDYSQLLGARIIAPDGVYLGTVIADTVNPESIMNLFGQYGLDTSPSSMFNSEIPYGGPDGVFSPFNDMSPSPPSLFKDGKFVNYLTTNDNYRPRVSPEKLIDFLDKVIHTKK